MEKIQLETERLIIRPHEAADFDDYFAYIMDPELQAHLGLNGVTDETSARETFQWLRENTTFLALVSKSEHRAIGHIALHPPYDKFAEDPAYKGKNGRSLSFAIARQEQRKGLMQEALKAVIGELFSHRSIEYIDVETEPDNQACCRLQEKLGFTLWGQDRFDDTELLLRVMTREDWERRRK